MRDESSPPLDYATPPRLQLHPVAPAAEVDQSTLIEAARRYRFLRRQAWRLVLHFLVCFAFFFPQVLIGDRLDNSTRGLLAGPFISQGCLITWVQEPGNDFAIARVRVPTVWQPVLERRSTPVIGERTAQKLRP